MVNSVVLIGRLTGAPERRTTTSGKNVCSFSVAVQKRIKPSDGSPDADFFRCSAWDKTADYMTQYLGKGRLIAIEGRLQSRKYTASDGSAREIVEIVAHSVQSLERPKDEGDTPQVASARSVPASTNQDWDPFTDE